ncbi:MAG: hypothetical protein AAF402_13670 [Pseudomonadota bacterium]
MSSRLITPLLALSLVAGSSAFALNADDSKVKAVSIEEVANLIRKRKQWKILDAKPKQASQGNYFRFKLLGNNGKVKIINIDPKKPNLRSLE